MRESRCFEARFFEKFVFVQDPVRRIAALLFIILLARWPAYAASGVLDANFGAGGISILRGDYDRELIQGMTLQPDGKVVAVGAFPYYLTSRFLPNGKLDASFGTAGVAQINIFTGNYSTLGAAAVGSDGRIVVAGADVNVGGTPWQHFFLAQLTPGGKLDPAFGGGTGTVFTNFRNGAAIQQFSSVLIQSDGKILVGGTVSEPGGSSGTDFVLARYLADGSPDRTFGTGGIVTTDFVSPDLPSPSSGVTDNDNVARIALDRHGRIVVVGNTVNGNERDAAVLRYLPTNGALDPTFGTGGKVRASVAGQANAMLMLPDGKLLVGGTVAGSSLLLRYNEDGSPDATFGPSGQGVAIGTSLFNIADLALRPDGSFVAANGWNLGAASFNADGSLDTTFGTGGLSSTVLPAGSNFTFSSSIVLEGGDVLVGGTSGRTTNFGVDDDGVIVAFTDRASIPEPSCIILITLAPFLLRRRRN